MSDELKTAMERLWLPAQHSQGETMVFASDLYVVLVELNRLREALSNARTTCAYCEAVHELPCTFDDIRAHVEQCPKHPMAALKAELARLRERDARVRMELGMAVGRCSCAHESSHGSTLHHAEKALALLKETP